MRDLLWPADGAVAEIYRRICTHPFIIGLQDGSLPHDRFRYYVVQDAHYLRGYARALAVCAAKSSRQAELAMFLDHAGAAIAAEQQLHAGLLDGLSLTAEQAAALPITPATRAYLSYLQATIHGGSYAEAVAAVLPCYWIYAKVGERLQQHGSADPLYQRWIDTYAGEQFQTVVGEVLDVTDRIGAQASQTERGLMRSHFHTTARYEWMFWDAAYRLEDWPV